MRRHLAMVAIGSLAAVVALGACSNNKGDNGGNAGDVSKNQGGISKDPKDSQGPAAPVPGAHRGGTLNVLQDSDYEHLDPQRTYVVQPMAIEQMFARTLTMFKDEGNGKLLLVGDLATDAGKDTSSGKCTQWTYTLKDGLKYEDGTPILAKDVAYGIARSYSSQLSEGPHYLAQWLSNDLTYDKVYKGPYNGGALVPPGLDVKGDKTLVFNFKKPQCDLPFALQMGTSAPVPQSKDTGPLYDNHPFSSGPYKVESYVRGTKLTLVRNPYWDPKTDPIRHDYPDVITTEIGPSDQQQSERAIASNGADQFASPEQQVPQSLLPQIQGRADLKSRVVSGQTPFVYYFAINNQKVKDPKVRQALSYAVDRGGLIQALGGPAVADPATTMLSPTTIGWKNYDAFPAGAHGNPKKAKDVLKGKKPPELVLGYRNNRIGQAEAPLFQQAFEKAGFKVTTRPIDSSNFFSLLQKKDNPWDIYLTDWAADWPTGAAVLPVLFDGRTIQPAGNNDTSYFNASDINTKIDEYSKMDANSAAPKWAELDKQITTKYAPAIPMYYLKGYTINGSKVAGVKLSTIIGTNVFTDAYLKP